jgi:hypothetical protein
MCVLSQAIFFYDLFIYFSLCGTGILNSGPLPWATLPVLFFQRVFEIGSGGTCLGWLEPLSSWSLPIEPLGPSLSYLLIQCLFLNCWLLFSISLGNTASVGIIGRLEILILFEGSQGWINLNNEIKFRKMNLRQKREWTSSDTWWKPLQ